MEFKLKDAEKPPNSCGNAEGGDQEEEEELPGPTLDELCADPEIIAVFADPETNQAFIDIDKDPKTIAHHQQNPKVQNVLKVIFKKLEPFLPNDQTLDMLPPGAMNSMAGLMQHLRMQGQGSGIEDPMALLSQLQQAGGGGELIQQLQRMGGFGRRKNKGLLTQ